MRFARSQTWLSLVAVVALTLIASGCGQKPAEQPTPEAGKGNDPPGPAPAPRGSEQETQELREAKPDIELAAGEYYTEFQKDVELKKYTGRVLDVRGKVLGCKYYGFSSHNTVNLALVDGSAVFEITCRELDALTKVAPDQTVTLRARCNALFSTDCIIVKVEGDAPPSLAANDLGKAFKLDKTAASAKYGNKWVRLMGTLQQIDGRTEYGVSSPGVEPQVKCHFDPDGLKVATRNNWFQSGKSAAILGLCDNEEPILRNCFTLPPAK